MANKLERHIEKYWDFRNKIDGVNYYTDNMLNKTLTMFRYDGLPESIPEVELEKILQIGGHGFVTEWNGELLAFSGGFAPPNNAYYMPKHYLVNNPWVNCNKEFEIGTEGVLIRNDPLMRGLLPIIHKNAAFLTETDLTMYLADVNYRAIFAIIANNDEEAESGKAFLKQMEEGYLGILLSEDMDKNINTQPYATSSQGYITQLIELKQYLAGTFLNEIGLNANYNMKRERLSANETELNEDSLRPLIDAMLEERQSACEKINELFGTEISVEFDSAWAKYNKTIGEDGVIDPDLAIEDVDEQEEEISEDVVEETETEPETEVKETDAEDTDTEESDTEESDTEESDVEEVETEEVDAEPDVVVEINIEQADEVTVEEPAEDAEVEEEDEEDESENEAGDE